MKKTVRYIQIILSILTFISVFIIPYLSGQLIVLSIFVLLSLINKQRKAIFVMFFKMSILLVFTLFVHLFFRFGDSAYWEAFRTTALWNKALFFTLRNGNVLFIMSYLIRGGSKMSISSITSYLEGKKPAKLIQPLTLAMRYVNLISDEFRSLQQVHRIMGIHRPKHLIAQTRYYTSLIVPTIISSLERAEHLSIAMTSRGYNQV
ncbi:MAG: energy-coupling factor transporter transmembrane protein EcfT [Candidatus Marinimicrobia bacterium]|nr:energy-coupling factor transporter transmembrane protein EcfT [Candidatus Neomarinimicrobiota bacterium]